MEVLPLRGNVLVKRSNEEIKKGSLVIVQTEKPAEGVVVAVGSGTINFNGEAIPMILKQGDCVLFHKGAGHEVKLDDGDYLILNESEILAILKK